MSKASTAGLAGLFTLGGLALVVLPIVRLIALSRWLGTPALSAFMFVEAMVLLGRAVIPLHSFRWFRYTDATRPDLRWRVVALELAVSTVAVAVLAATASWWAPVVGYAPPVWLMAVVGLRLSGWSVSATLGVLRRPVAIVVLLVDLVVTLPIAALVTHSLATAVIASTVVTWLCVAFALWMRPYTPPAGKTDLFAPDDPDGTRDRWKLGSWLDDLSDQLRRPVFVAVAGLGILVPFSAATTLTVILGAPFDVLAKVSPSRDMFNRFVRGLIMASLAVWFMHALGPAIYRAIYPASFGDGHWLEILAWSGLSAIPFAMRGDTEQASQLRTAVAAVISLGLLVGLTLAYGAQGVLYAVAISGTVGLTIGMTTKKSAVDRLRSN